MSSIAVFLVLGGATAFAASNLGKNTVGSNQIKKNAVTTAKIKNGAVSGEKLKLSSIGTVPSATSATTAGSATTANSAKTAETANNALALGGVPASGYTRSDCNSLTGQIKGFARINDAQVSTTGLSTAGVEVPYNCSGLQVLARRGVTGKYEVKFVGSPVAIALATAMSATGTESFSVNFASVNRISNGDFFVQLWNAPLAIFINDSFTILTP
jgi:hypothetical protein